MRISASEVSFAAAHTRRDLVERRLEIRVAQPAIADPGPAATAATAPVEPIAFEGNLTPALGLIKLILEKLLGCTIRLNGKPACETSAPAGAPSVPAASPTPAGVEIHASERTQNEEHLRVAAQGSVRTADGRSITFDLSLSLDRQRIEEFGIDARTGQRTPRPKDPLVLNLDGAAARPGGGRFDFDLDADGTTESVPALGSGTVFLVLDANANGRVDDGSELFGTRSGDGFADLARHDADRNGWIDEADPVWSRLKVWQPGAEAQTLAQADVGAIALAHVASAFEHRDGDDRPVAALRDTGVFLRESGAAGTVQQLDLFV